MATYREQLEIVRDMKVREDESRRVNCPFCGGRKTFTIDKRLGQLVWNCYKASCDGRGRLDADMSGATIQRRLNGERPGRKSIVRPLPEHTSNPRNHPEAIRYLESVGSLEAFENRLLRVRFAPAENRVLFYMPNGDGAVGRAMDRRKPKWLAYGDCTGVLTVGHGDTAVVVEDAASACSVSRIPELTGCAILGTNLSSLARGCLRSFARVIVALDKDASRKAVALSSALEGRVPTRVACLDEDLKYCSTQKIRDVLIC